MRRIPNYLDEPPQILLWELDECVLLSIMFAIGILMDALFKLIVLGFVGIKFYRKIKDRRPAGFLFHAVYWYTGIGSSVKKPTSLPNPFIHRFF